MTGITLFIGLFGEVSHIGMITSDGGGKWFNNKISHVYAITLSRIPV